MQGQRKHSKLRWITKGIPAVLRHGIENPIHVCQREVVTRLLHCAYALRDASRDRPGLAAPPTGAQVQQALGSALATAVSAPAGSSESSAWTLDDWLSSAGVCQALAEALVSGMDDIATWRVSAECAASPLPRAAPLSAHGD